MYYEDARKYMEEAVQIDSTFAVAWLYLSNAYGSLENIQMRDKAIKKAYAYSSRATEKEQLAIKAVYARVINNDSGEEFRLLTELVRNAPKEKRAYFSLGSWYKLNNNPDEAIKQFSKAIDLDPQFGEAINQIAYQYLKKGEFAKALDNFRRYAALYPDDANPHDSMGDLLWQMGKLDEAIAEFKKALGIKPDFHVSAGKIAYIYCLKEDYSEADKWISRAIYIAPSPGTKAAWYWVSAWIDYWCGKPSAAITSLDQSFKLAVTQDNFSTMAGVDWFSALMDLDLGKYDSGKEHYLKAFRILLKNSTSPKNDSAAWYVFAGKLSIGKGQLDSAHWCLNEMNRLMKGIEAPSIYQVRYWYDWLTEEILLSEKDYSGAIEYIKNSKEMGIPEFAFPQILIYNIPFKHDLLARAYIGLGMTDEAITEYESLITFNPEGNDRRLINPKYHYSLGLLYEKKGMKDKAIAQYRKFLELWKDADPIFPEPGDARERMNGLMSR
jgi:tetratricopeptide (TPR) repeat protein